MRLAAILLWHDAPSVSMSTILTIHYRRLALIPTSFEGVKALLHYVVSKMNAARNRCHIHGSRLLLVFRCDRFCTCSALLTVAVIFFPKRVASRGGVPSFSGLEKGKPATVIFLRHGA